VAVALSEAVLAIPGTPPSFNQVGLRTHWAVGRRHKLKWQEFCTTALLEQRVPRNLDAVMVSARLEFPQRRRRDEGNFRVIIEKALGDALVAGGWIEDDTPDHYTFGAVELVAPAPAARTLVTIAWDVDKRVRKTASTLTRAPAP